MLISLKAELGALNATNQNGEKNQKISILDEYLTTTEDIEIGYERLIKELHEEKRKVLAKVNAQTALHNLDQRWMYPAWIDAKKIQKDKADCFDSKEVLKSIIRYRDAVVKICANSHFTREGNELVRLTEYAIGQVNRDKLSGDGGSDAKYFRQLLENVHPDDRESLFEILISLTPRPDENQKFSALEALHFLCIQESRILLARKIALSLIKSRVSTCGYAFDRVLPLAYGPSYANPGEEVNVQIMMAAFDSENNPEVTCAQGGKFEVNNGIAVLRIKIDETTTLNGTISIMNKQGAVKTEKWEVRIPVIEEP